GARTDREARRAITTFLAAFQDGHVGVVSEPPAAVQWVMEAWKGHRHGADRRPDGSWTGEQACASLGYEAREGEYSVPLAKEAGYRDVGALAPMRAGVIARGGDTLGVVRFRLFSQRASLPACITAWERVVRDSLRGRPCDDGCEERLYQASAAVMTDSLRAWLGALRRAGARTVLVDIAGNGGGTEWVEEAAQLFAAGPLEPPVVTGVVHAHTAQRLEDRVADLDRLLRQVEPDHPGRAAAVEQRNLLDSLAGLARGWCDRRGIWRDTSVAQRCPAVLPPALAAAAEANRPDPAPPAWTGPVVILADHRTASASEEFVTLLHDNGKARLIGERTLGAGCGYTNGGIPLTLANSGIKVHLPDCARIRRNGRNEVFGIEPDEQVPLEAKAVIAAALEQSS
ncbi:MAG TPA: S41 family peptidase, partial [Gemmatimonadaceae bacterium]